jgi:Flp pilus assembly protein TadG
MSPQSTRRHPTASATRRGLLSRLSRRCHDERGSVAAELTLVTPFLVLLLVFVAVLVHRGVDARLRLDDVAHQGARAASLTRSPAAATDAAQQTVTAALAQAGVDCLNPSVEVDTSDFQPGGLVTVTVVCHVDLTNGAELDAGTTRTLTATASSPIDAWRAAADIPPRPSSMSSMTGWAA